MKVVVAGQALGLVERAQADAAVVGNGTQLLRGGVRISVVELVHHAAVVAVARDVTVDTAQRDPDVEKQNGIDQVDRDAVERPDMDIVGG